MKDFLKEIIRLWWVEAGTELNNPKSEASIKALKTILREDFELDSEFIDYIVDSVNKTPTNFVLHGDHDSGIKVGKNQTAVSAKIHPDWDEEEITEDDDSENDDSDEEVADKDDSIKDIKLNGLTDYEKDKLKEGLISEARFSYTTLTKDGGKYLPQWLDYIQNGKPFQLEDAGEVVLDKKNLKSKGFSDKTLLQILSGGSKEDAAAWFKTNTTPILLGKDGKKYSLESISKSTFTSQGGGSKPRDAASYEMGICVEYNRLQGMDYIRALSAAGGNEKNYAKFKDHLTEVGSKVAKNLPNMGSFLKQTGGDKYTPASVWPSSNGTPKTDIYGGSSWRVSVKKQGGSQLVSGKGGDAKGVFQGALSFYDKYDSKDGQSHIKKVIDGIESDFKTYNSDNSVTTVRNAALDAFLKWRVPQIKSKANKNDIKKHAKAEAIGAGITGARGKWGEWFLSDVEPLTDKQVLAWFSGHWKSLGSVALQEEMKNVVGMAIDHKRIDANFKQAFNNDDFKKWCVYEATSGTYKFAGVADKNVANDAVANKILVFGEDGYTKVVDVNEKWAKGYASSVTPIVAFKSSGRSKFTAFRLMQEGFDNSKTIFENDLYTIIEEESNKIDNLITESVAHMDLLLTEISIKGMLASIAKIAKALLKKITESIKNFYNKVIKRVLQKLKEFATEGIEAFLDYIGIEINGSAPLVINF